MSEGHPAPDAGHLQGRYPRQLARFLCGLSSPATCRLRRHGAYGSQAEQPFRQVLAEVERRLDDLTPS